MTLVFADSAFERHRTGYHHPETSERVASSLHRLEGRDWFKALKRGKFAPIPDERLLRTHTAQVVKNLDQAASEGGGNLDGDTYVSPESALICRLAAGAAWAACEQVLSGQAENAFCLTRPPGHHASRESSRGFCIFNNIAIAAHYALDVHDLSRILIVDFDVHHGDGTQAIFYDDPAVDYVSIHRYPFYPGTGHQSETGTGAGLGHTHNAPIAFGTSREHYLDAFRKTFDRAVEKAKPELILLSAGFDAHTLDPIGSLGLDYEDFQDMTRHILNAASVFAKGRLVSILEGGYNLTTLPKLIEEHLLELSKTDARSKITTLGSDRLGPEAKSRELT
jgi:acetoin utilization deacetylase AcuC-like enzyme